jgi:hypothetical protein
MEYHQLPFDQSSLELAIHTSQDSKATILLAHGAGAGMEHPFMRSLAEALHKYDFNVVRFNFPYVSEKRKFTGSPARNIAAWKTVVEWALLNFTTPLFLAGKSYGGRMASHLLAQFPQKDIKGVVYFGFPLHAPGKESKDRANHLIAIPQPQLFLQGTKDTLANISLIREVTSVIPQAKLIELSGADHSFKLKGKKAMESIELLAHEVLSWALNKKLSSD